LFSQPCTPTSTAHRMRGVVIAGAVVQPERAGSALKVSHAESVPVPGQAVSAASVTGGRVVVVCGSNTVGMVVVAASEVVSPRSGRKNPHQMSAQAMASNTSSSARRVSRRLRGVKMRSPRRRSLKKLW
jgi:hypothetical protein